MKPDNLQKIRQQRNEGFPQKNTFHKSGDLFDAAISNQWQKKAKDRHRKDNNSKKKVKTTIPTLFL